MEKSKFWQRMAQKIFIIVVMGIFLFCLGGCHYYQEYRLMKTDADLQEERGEIMKAQRVCVQKYETQPGEAEKRCGMYKEMLGNFETNP